MQLPPELGWMDVAFLGTVTFFLMAWVQYWKESLPDNNLIVRLFSLASAVGFSYVLCPVMDKPMSIMAIVLYAIAAAIFGNFGYQLLSGSKSKPFSIPSQSQLKVPPTP